MTRPSSRRAFRTSSSCAARNRSRSSSAASSSSASGFTGPISRSSRSSSRHAGRGGDPRRQLRARSRDGLVRFTLELAAKSVDGRLLSQLGFGPLQLHALQQLACAGEPALCSGAFVAQFAQAGGGRGNRQLALDSLGAKAVPCRAEHSLEVGELAGEAPERKRSGFQRLSSPGSIRASRVEPAQPSLDLVASGGEQRPPFLQPSCTHPELCAQGCKGAGTVVEGGAGPRRLFGDGERLELGSLRPGELDLSRGELRFGCTKASESGLMGRPDVVALGREGFEALRRLSLGDLGLCVCGRGIVESPRRLGAGRLGNC